MAASLLEILRVDPGPPSRRRQAVRSGDGVALLDSGHGGGRQFVPANA